MTNKRLIEYIAQHGQEAVFTQEGKLLVNDRWYKDGIEHTNWVEITPTVDGAKDWLGY